MKNTLTRLAVALLAWLALALQPALAGMLLNSFVFASGGGAPAPTLSFQGCTIDETDLTTYTFTAHAVGSAATGRRILVGVSTRDVAANFSTSSMTVGGNAATEIVDTADAGALVQSAIYLIEDATGTTEDIAVTASELVSSMAICVWAAYDLTSSTADATAVDFETASASQTLDLNVVSAGIAVGISNTTSASGTTVWTGMTENAPETNSTTQSLSTAETSSIGTPLSVSSDWSGSSDSTGATASFH